MADLSRWGIQPPQNPQLLSWETAKGDLEHFLGSNHNEASAARLAHIEGPHGSGKSTGMIEFIWEKTHASDHDNVAIYVPAFGLEALMLSAYFQTKASPHQKLKQNICVGLEKLESKLHLATAAQLRTALRGVLRTGTPRRVVLLMDLELSPTADGELLLSELVKWHRGLTLNCDLTLITMASFTRPPVHKFLEAWLNTKCRHITFASPHTPVLTSKNLPLSTIWWQESDKNLPTLILGALRAGIPDTPELYYSLQEAFDVANEMKSMRSRMEDLDGAVAAAEATEIIDRFSLTTEGCPLGPCVVVIQNDQNTFGISKMLYENPNFANVVQFQVSPDMTLGDWLEAIIYPGPKVVYIEPGVPVVLYLPRVTAILSLSTCYSKTFDPETCALIWTNTPKSRMELLKEQSYARKTCAPRIPTPVKFYCVDKDDGRFSSANFDEWTLAPLAPAYEDQFMRLCFEVCVPWPDDKDPLVPLPAVSSIEHMGSVWKSLINMGCLSHFPSGSNRPVLNGPRAKRTLDFLDSKYNDFGTVPLAFLLAGIHDAESDATKRVIIRIASIISEDTGAVYFSELLEGKRKEIELSTNSRVARKDAIMDIHEIMAWECVGIGKQELDRGAMWMILGLFLRAEVSQVKGKDLGAEEKGCDAGIDLEAFPIILEKVRELESIHGIELSEDPIRDTTLSPDEVSYVSNDLMKAWSSQIVYFKRKSGMACHDLTSFREVQLGGFPYMNAYELFDRDTSPDNDMVFAFYTDQIISDGYGWVFNLTRVPTRSLVEWVRKDIAPL